TLDRVDSVSEETCAEPLSGTSVELKDRNKVDLGEGMIGRWIEVTGRLEKLEGHNQPSAKDPRELHLQSFRILPVVKTVTKEVIIQVPGPTTVVQSPPAQVAEAAPQEQPVATSGVQEAP